MTSILKTDEIQSQNGGSVVKIQTLKHPSASGNNITLDSSNNVSLGGTLSAGNIGSSVTGFGLIRNAQEFRIQGEFAGSSVVGTVLGSGGGNDTWGENNTDYSRHGVSIWSQSSGVFTCSVTGVFLCTWCVSVSDATSASDKFDPNVQIDSGSGYATRAKVWGHVYTSTFAMPIGNTFMFKVTNTSDFKLRVRQSESNSLASGQNIQGATDVSYTNIVFLRLGDV